MLCCAASGGTEARRRPPAPPRTGSTAPPEIVAVGAAWVPALDHAAADRCVARLRGTDDCGHACLDASNAPGVRIITVTGHEGAFRRWTRGGKPRGQPEWAVPAARREAKSVSVPGRILFLHGGAHCHYSARDYRPLTSRLAAATGCPVLCLDMRLAPEHPFPAALEDAAKALRWLSRNGPPGGGGGAGGSTAEGSGTVVGNGAVEAGAGGGGPSTGTGRRPPAIFVAGDSSGGGLAASLLLLAGALAEGPGSEALREALCAPPRLLRALAPLLPLPRPDAGVLLSPWLDLACEGYAARRKPGKCCGAPTSGRFKRRASSAGGVVAPPDGLGREWDPQTRTGDPVFSRSAPEESRAGRNVAMAYAAGAAAAEVDEACAAETLRAPLASPLFAPAAALARLPRCLVICGDEELMMREAVRFGQRLRAAREGERGTGGGGGEAGAADGADARDAVEVWERMWHCFPMYGEGCGGDGARPLPEAGAALRRVGAFLREGVPTNSLC